MSYEPKVSGATLTSEQRQKVAESQGLVWYVVNRMTNMPGDEDAFMAGVCGLAKAVQQYEPERGYAFSTFAVHLIRNAIQMDPLVGSHRRNCKGHASRFRAVSLEASIWRSTWDGDGVYLQTNDVASRSGDEIEDLIDNLAGESALDVVLDTCIDDREVAIIWDRFVEGLTYSAIGENWNLTGGRIQQIVSRVINRVRVTGAWKAIKDQDYMPRGAMPGPKTGSVAVQEAMPMVWWDLVEEHRTGLRSMPL